MKFIRDLKIKSFYEALLLISVVTAAPVAFATGASAPADAPAYKEPITDSQLGEAPKVGHRLVFEHPLVLDTKKVPVTVTRLEQEFNGKTKEFDIADQDEQLRYCNMRLAIQGRDIALNNANIGEHYFGKMQLSCAQVGSQPSFTTTFSRVFILGIRNCVESDTMVDQDYCNLYVVALRKKTDAKESNGDLIKDTGNILEKYVVSSSDAKDDIIKGGFLPAGVNEESIDGFQTFKLSIGKNVGEYFIPPTTASSSLGRGKSYYLQVLEDTTRQAQVEDEVRAKLSELETLVAAIRSSPQPLDAFNTQSAAYFKTYAATAKTLLEVVHPVTFYRFEAQLKGIESEIIGMLKTWDKAITNQDSFLSKYSSALGEYDRLKGYYSENAKVDQVDYSKLISAKAVTQPASEDRRLKQSFVGKIIEESAEYESSANRDAQFSCGNYIREHADAGTIELFGCQFVRQYSRKNMFGSDSTYYAQYKIVPMN